MSPPPGLPRERTWLAWRRTAASCVVLGLLVARVSWMTETSLGVVAAGVVLAAVLSVTVLVRRGHRSPPGRGEGPFALVVDGRVPAGVAALALAVAAVVVLLAWS